MAAGAFVLRHLYPLRLATLASSPKGTPLGYAGNFSATAEAVPLGKVASPQAMTEGVLLPRSRTSCRRRCNPV